ncbi:MAG TPA: hypothetical protein DEQ09_05080 [Bacteroidales bacterium]|nr:hypothetical protein [Bacteroidales bacterium]
MTWLITILLPYVFLFLVLWGRQQLKKSEGKTEVRRYGKNQKLFSVIIPVKNEAANIKKLINDLAEQELDPLKFEIIFVDDKSSDSTVEIINNSSIPLPEKKILYAAGNGKKRAIALGINNAKGEFIVTTDGDCRVKKKWLKELYDHVLLFNSDMIIGAVDIIDTGKVSNRLIQLEFLSLQAITEIFTKNDMPVMCNGANLCFKNPGDRYLEMVKPDIVSGDDIFLMENFRQQGKSISWIGSADSTVLTYGPDSIRSFLKQRIRWTSKSPFYKDPFLLGISSIVFLTNLAVSIVFTVSLFIPSLWVVYLSMIILKSIPDMLMLITISVKRHKAGLLSLFLPAQFLYPFYVAITGLAGIFTGLSSLQRDK